MHETQSRRESRVFSFSHLILIIMIIIMIIIIIIIIIIAFDEGERFLILWVSCEC